MVFSIAEDALHQHFPQKLARQRSFCPCHFLGRAGCDDHAAVFAALRPQIDYVISDLDHVQMMLNHNYRVPSLDQLA